MAHWFVSSHRGDSKCYSSPMDAVRAQILKDLAKGLAVFAECGDGNLRDIAHAIEEASGYPLDEEIRVGHRHWILQECHDAMCRDIAEETMQW